MRKLCFLLDSRRGTIISQTGGRGENYLWQWKVKGKGWVEEDSRLSVALSQVSSIEVLPHVTKIPVITEWPLCHLPLLPQEESE